ncbi:MAG: enoyl-CoA hydratase-related protein [Methylococcales bacterium]
MTVDKHGVARMRLNRPESHNALNPELLEMLGEILQEIDRSAEIRSVELSSTGKHFCSGMDLKWLQESFESAGKALDREFYKLGVVLHQLYHLSKSTVAIVQGAAYGGGAGLACCCDIALASTGARFCFSEVRLGLIPAIISPFVIHAIGERIARRYFLSGEVIEAREAYRIGLVHEVLDDAQISARALALHGALSQGAPKAISRIKSLLIGTERMPLSDATLKKTVEWLEETRDADEAREGISAFLGKRNPNWVK